MDFYDPTPVDRIRQARGLLRHYRRSEKYRRGCVEDLGKAVRGTCVWCGQPADTKRKTWHPHCVAAFQAAKGYTKFVSTLIPYWVGDEKAKCEMCDRPGEEIDHRLALSIAHRLGRRAELRAYRIENLRWLCRECHAVKTAADRRVLARMNRKVEQGELF